MYLDYLENPESLEIKDIPILSLNIINVARYIPHYSIHTLVEYIKS